MASCGQPILRKNMWPRRYILSMWLTCPLRYAFANVLVRKIYRGAVMSLKAFLFAVLSVGAMGFCDQAQARQVDQPANGATSVVRDAVPVKSTEYYAAQSFASQNDVNSWNTEHAHLFTEDVNDLKVIFISNRSFDSMQFRVNWAYGNPSCAPFAKPLTGKPVECLRFISLTDDVARFYPARAVDMKLEAFVSLNCIVVDEDANFKCSTSSVDVVGDEAGKFKNQDLGFARAAENIVHRFLKLRKVKSNSGSIVGTEFEFTYNFILR